MRLVIPNTLKGRYPVATIKINIKFNFTGYLIQKWILLKRRISNLFRVIRFKEYPHEDEKVREFLEYLLQNMLYDEGLGRFTAEECLKAYFKKRMSWERLSILMNADEEGVSNGR